MSLPRKRKYPNPSASANPRTDLDPILFIRAYEADIIRGPQAAGAARSLEIVKTKIATDANEDGEKPARWDLQAGDGLIKWNESTQAGRVNTTTGIGSGFDDEEPSEYGAEGENEVWVDRFDARLLLDTLPPVSYATSDLAASPTGWSDLPSDTEDTFFMSPDEVEDYQKQKRRRDIDRNREDRLRALREKEGEENVDDEDMWGGSDEEPDDTQKELMRRSAVHILSSPNPAHLEMRILANHGGDKRFAFLRGRWARAWKLIQGRARMEKENAEKEKDQIVARGSLNGGLGVLDTYGDSDVDSDKQEDEGNVASKKEAALLDTKMSTKVEEKETARPNDSAETFQVTDEAAKEARRTRAREWADKRRAEKAAQS